MSLGFVVYSFFSLFEEYLGPDTDSRLAKLQSKRGYLMPPPACCFTYDPENKHFLSYCKTGVLQYAFVRIVTTIASLILELSRMYCPDSMALDCGHFYTTILNGLSVSLAMFTLISLYIPIRHDIASYKPVLQFFAIKFFIFFQIWLGIGIGFMASRGMLVPPAGWPVSEYAASLHSFLICIEMAFASVIHRWAFDYTRYIPGNGCATTVWQGINDSLWMFDLVHDFIWIVQFLRRRASSATAYLGRSNSSNSASSLLGHGQDPNDQTDEVDTE